MQSITDQNSSTSHEVDQSAVDIFVAQAAGATPAQRSMVAKNLRAMVARSERAKGPNGYVSLATMTATADAIESL